MIPLNIKPKINQRRITQYEILIENKTSTQTIDIFLSKTSSNSYYRYLLITLILIFMSDGAEMVVIALNIDCLAIEFNLNTSEKGLLASIVFIGLLIGPVLASKINDKYGRKTIVIFSTIMIVSFGILAAFSNSYILLTTLRFILGIGIGFCVPPATSLISESVPVELRSFYLNNVWISAPLGELYIYFLCYLLSLNKNCYRWRYIMGLAALPSLIALLLLGKIKESVRFLLLKNRNEEGFEILDKFGEGKNLKLSELEKKMIISEVQESNFIEYEDSFNSLLTEDYRDTSIKLWLICFFNSFIIYGGMYIFPQILKALKENESDSVNIDVYLDLIFTSIINMPTTFIAGYLSDLSMLGRKYSMALGFGIGSFICFYCVIFSHISYVSYSIMRIGLGISFSVLGVYCSEVYPTRIRTIGNSATNAVSRLGGFIAPIIMELLFKNFGYNSPIFIFFIFSILGGGFSFLLQVETYKKSLDFSMKISSYEMNKF